MKTDSKDTRKQKQRIREQIKVAFGIDLPDWLVEGAYSNELRAMSRFIDHAHTRYSTEDVPTK